MAGFNVSANYYIEIPDVTDENDITQTSLDIEGLSSVNNEGDLVYNGIAYPCLEVIVNDITTN